MAKWMIDENKMRAIKVFFGLLTSALIWQNSAIAQPENSVNNLTPAETTELQQLRQEKMLQSQRGELITLLMVSLLLFSLASALSFWGFNRYLLQKISELMQAHFQSLEASQKAATSARNAEVELDQFITLAEFSSQVAAFEEKINRLQGKLTAEQETVHQEIEQIKFNLQQFAMALTTPAKTEDISEQSLEQPVETLEVELTPLTLEDCLKEGDLRYTEQDYLEATIAYNKALKINPNLAEVRYRNACAYAIIGRTNPAIGNLQWAIDLEGEYRGKAAEERAFDSLRFDSQFKQLIKG